MNEASSDRLAAREHGDRGSRIWLLGDSLPEKWAEHLATPLDPRHPARHSIWTPVQEVIQRQVFPRRVRESAFYIRNALPLAGDWERESFVASERADFSRLLVAHRPTLLISFGSKAARFVSQAMAYRHSHAETALKAITAARRYKRSEELGDAFRAAVETFDPCGINHFPLLHATIARGQFLTAHRRFVDGRVDARDLDQNAFEYVGCALARILLKFATALDVWDPRGQ